MLYTSHAPMAPLADFVEYFWSLSDVPAHAQERVVPSSTLELVVNLHEDEVRIHPGSALRRWDEYLARDPPALCYLDEITRLSDDLTRIVVRALCSPYGAVRLGLTSLIRLNWLSAGQF